MQQPFLEWPKRLHLAIPAEWSPSVELKWLRRSLLRLVFANAACSKEQPAIAASSRQAWKAIGSYWSVKCSVGECSVSHPEIIHSWVFFYPSQHNMQWEGNWPSHFPPAITNSFCVDHGSVRTNRLSNASNFIFKNATTHFMHSSHQRNSNKTKDTLLHASPQSCCSSSKGSSR